MGAIDLVIQVESPTSVASGLQRIGRAGHTVDATSSGKIFPKYRGDLLEVGRRRAAHARRRHRVDARAAQPARRAGPADRGDVLAGAVVGRRAVRRVPPRLQLRHAAARPVRGRAGHAGRPLPVGRVLEPQGAPDLGPRGGHGRGPRRRARGRGHQRRHDPRARPVRRVPGRGRPARGRARRGDGVREPPRRDVRARRQHLAHRAHHARSR